MAIALRPFIIDDAPQLTRHLNDPQIAAWLANVPVPYFQDHARSFIDAVSAADAENAAFAIVNESTPDTLLGGIGCRPPPQEAVDALAEKGHENISGSIGYWIAKSSWGQGAASRAVALALPLFAQTSLGQSVCAMTLIDNPASARVLEKCGFAHVTQAEMPHQGEMEMNDIYVRT